MLKRIIERYLRASTEREYDIPFRQLLWAMGFELLDNKTIHGPLEFGKDIRAVHPNKIPRVWVFQTKQGNIEQDDWNEMERQLKLMLVMPTNHPNVPNDEPRQAVWVCTGDLAATVGPIMSQFNKVYVQQGFYPVKVWNLNTLVDLFEEYFFNVNICPDNLILDVLNLLTGFSNVYFNYSLYDKILAKLLNETLTKQSPRKIQQTLALVEIVAHHIVGRGYEIENLYSALEALEATIITVWKYGISTSFRYDILEMVDRIHLLLLSAYDNLIEGLSPVFSSTNGLFDSTNAPSEMLAYPHRTFEILGMLSYRVWVANWFDEKDTFTRYATYIEQVLLNNPSAMHPIWERAQEDILLTAYALWHSGRNEIAAQWIEQMANWLHMMYGNRGGLARPKASVHDVVEQIFGIHLSFTSVQPVQSSYLCYTIIELCYWFQLQKVFENFVGLHKQTPFVEFVYKDNLSIFEAELSGRREEIAIPANWNKFLDWYKKRYEHPNAPSGESPDFKERPWILLLVSSHFGNRVFPSLLRQSILDR